MKKAYAIEFEPVGQKVWSEGKESLWECARRIGAGINSVCGGRGTCHTCHIKLINGKLSKPTQKELKYFSSQEIKEGWRLACQAKPIASCRVMIPPESMNTSQRICLEGRDIDVAPKSLVIGYPLRLSAPSLSDTRSDADRLFQALKKQHAQSCKNIDNGTLHSLSPQLRAWKWKCQASVRDNEVIAIYPRTTRQLGLAIDLGTTTIAGYLLDLNSGHTLSSQGIINPQMKYGEDIISRIDCAIKSPDDSIRLQKIVVKQLNGLASTLCSQAGVKVETIVEAVIVGNTAMHHLLLGLPVRQLALSPFTPVVSMALEVKARDLGLNIAPGAYIHFPPIIAGFIGSDHVAMLLANDSPDVDGPVIIMDIGTNTEISLVNGKRVISTSCASGPAFEGGHIKCGMRATKGAIERLQLTDTGVNYQTIGDVLPVGICGSGILDALAEMYLSGVIDDSGRLVENHPRICMKKKQAEFILIGADDKKKQHEIVVTQKDIRELQLAKAAIRTGIQLLLEAENLNEEQIKRVIVAGAFGSYINLSSAIITGLVPPLPLSCFRQIGNAAGTGAKMTLISLDKRKETQKIANSVRYIELAGNPHFQHTFINTSYIGRYWIHHGRREAI